MAIRRRAPAPEGADRPRAAFDERMLRAFGNLEANRLIAFVRRVAGPPARLVTLGAAAGLLAGLVAGCETQAGTKRCPVRNAPRN
jgi:hypothetical protein